MGISTVWADLVNWLRSKAIIHTGGIQINIWTELETCWGLVDKLIVPDPRKYNPVTTEYFNTMN